MEVRSEEDVMIQRVIEMLPPGFEDGWRNHKPRDVDHTWSLEKAKKQIIPTGPSEVMPSN
jgi:hypothetical protein